MEQRALIKYLRKKSHELAQIHSKLVEHYENKALSCIILYYFILYYLILSYIILSYIILSYPDVSYWVRQFRMRREAIEIRDAAEDLQISKLLSELREHSKHYPMLQFETLLRLPALLRQRYSIFSLKSFM
jgi:hypothetical protein